MSDVNFKRCGTLINASHLYSLFTVIFVITAICQRDILWLNISLLCFVLTAVALSMALFINYDLDENPGKLKLGIGFIILIPYTVIGGLILLIFSIIINICFKERSE